MINLLYKIIFTLCLPWPWKHQYKSW